MTDLERAVAVLESGTREEVVTFLLGLTSQQRKALGPKFRGWLTQGSSVRVPHDRQSLAVVATADGMRQARVFSTHGWGHTEEFVEDAVRVLADRAPAWLPNFVEAILDEGSWEWRVARGIVRAGLVPEPNHPAYYSGTVHGLGDEPYMADRRRLIDYLRRDPGLIGEHLLLMLSTEGVGRSLASHDHYRETTRPRVPEDVPFTAGTWRIALLTLADEGRLDRGRLLDTVLAAPLRDWAAVDLGWYVGLHDALDPTLDEIAERQSTYVRMLTVEHGPSVKAAQRALHRLMPDQRFEPEPFLAVSRATLERTDKATVTAHLGLLERLSGSRPEVNIADTVRVASEHARPDVRERAAKVLARLGEDPPAAARPSSFSPSTPEQRPVAPAVPPIGSADELAELLLGLLAEIDPLEMERAIDGLLRLADDRPSTADLLMSTAIAAEYYQDDPRIAARTLALAWLTPRKRFKDGDWDIHLGHTLLPAQCTAPETFVGAVGLRLTGVARAIRSGRHASVALPSATDCTIRLDDLNHRLRGIERATPLLEFELAIALLRVPEHHRTDVAIPASMRRSAVVSRVLDGASPSWERHLASFQRLDWEPQRQIPVFRDTRAPGGSAVEGLLARATPERTIGVETQYGEYDPRFEQTMALGASLLPHDHDVLAAHVHPYLHRDLRKDRAACATVFDAIAQARTANGSPSSSALVLGLAAKDARGRTAAQDAILDLARFGVLDGTSLGRQAALLLQDEVVVGQRISSGLAECVRASDSVVLPVLDALRAIVMVLPGRRDAGAYVELAADLVERTGRTMGLPEEFHKLAAAKSSSTLAKATRRVLKVA